MVAIRRKIENADRKFFIREIILGAANLPPKVFQGRDGGRRKVHLGRKEEKFAFAKKTEARHT